MKLGQNLFKKDQSIWGKPIIEYDQGKMNELFSEIGKSENGEAKSILPEVPGQRVSLETELYLLLHY